MPITDLPALPARNSANFSAGMDAFFAALPALITEMNQYVGAGAKAWCKCGVAGDIDDDFNVASITDSGTGIITVAFTVAFSSVNYVVVGTAETTSSDSLNITAYSQAVGSCVLHCQYGANPGDPVHWHFACFGDS